MEAANWVFDHNQNNSSSSVGAQQIQHQHKHQQQHEHQHQHQHQHKQQQQQQQHHHHQQQQQQQHQQHQASIQSDTNFLNFESPDNNSNVSQVALSLGFNHQTTNHESTEHTSSGLTNSSSDTSSNRNHINEHDDFQSYLSSNSPIDIIDSAANTQHKEDLSQWANISDFNDLEINFFHSDAHSVTNHVNSNVDSHLKPINTVPPTPSSFDVSNYHSHSQLFTDLQSPVTEDYSQSIRPDVVFTPLVSPAVTPLDSMINKHNNSNNNNNNSLNISIFSPLTSPALEAKSPMKLKKSSSPEDSSSNSIAKKYSKRKTPGNTPIVGPTIPGRITKRSPVIKARRSSSYTTTVTHHHYNANDPEQKDDSGVMAPPKPRRSRKLQSNVPTVNCQPATPATLMNFRLESSSIQSPPVILPSNDSRSLSSSTIKNWDEEVDPNDPNDPNSKKTSHKLAEQGRRNRMNQAIQDLSALIPKELSSTVTIPSKATTVELASQYIKTLLKEVDRLKYQLQSDMGSNKSISPLETTGDH